LGGGVKKECFGPKGGGISGPERATLTRFFCLWVGGGGQTIRGKDGFRLGGRGGARGGPTGTSFFTEACGGPPGCRFGGGEKKGGEG